MNNISQISVFDYRKIEILGDLERIKLFFENLDDKELCESLENEIKNINEKLVKYMYENLEDFGTDCAVDGKFLDTYANQYSKEKMEKEIKN